MNYRETIAGVLAVVFVGLLLFLAIGVPIFLITAAEVPTDKYDNITQLLRVNTSETFRLEVQECMRDNVLTESEYSRLLSMFRTLEFNKAKQKLNEVSQ
jgi:hypothetical protein